VLRGWAGCHGGWGGIYTPAYTFLSKMEWKLDCAAALKSFKGGEVDKDIRHG